MLIYVSALEIVLNYSRHAVLVLFALGKLYHSDARIHLWKIFCEDRSTRHVILNEKNAWPPRARKRVRLSCVSDATSPVLHHVDAHASYARI
ncbi:hypothetical protein Y032_0085g1876 [Ancylostoma ceylanicum]|uniref:Uncharacterized protein n=1 Tax=Ancylostoma ceylanicum TaxID=53326 RepID=A0A016TQL7_9BILA|nr:hypothetical protein Y032_0085g1876 [Ancylostoma ceylanicum]